VIAVCVPLDLIAHLFTKERLIKWARAVLQAKVLAPDRKLSIIHSRNKRFRAGLNLAAFHQFPGRGIDIWQAARFAPFESSPAEIIEFLDHFQFAPEGERVKFAVLLEPASLPRHHAPVYIRLFITGHSCFFFREVNSIRRYPQGPGHVRLRLSCAGANPT